MEPQSEGCIKCSHLLMNVRDTAELPRLVPENIRRASAWLSRALGHSYAIQRRTALCAKGQLAAKHGVPLHQLAALQVAGCESASMEGGTQFLLSTLPHQAAYWINHTMIRHEDVIVLADLINRASRYDGRKIALALKKLGVSLNLKALRI